MLLAGAVTGTPENLIYFLEVDTTGITGAPNPTRWTFWNALGLDNGGTSAASVQPAYPFDPSTNFGTLTGVPMGFQGTNYYYLISRFAFAFNLIALFFMVLALFTGLAALCSRIGSYLSSVLTFTALIFEILFAALMTTAFVKGRDLFQANNQTATLGRYAFGFVWAAVALLLLSTTLFCLGGAFSKKAEYGSSGRRFGRKRSTRSRGSFIDTDSQRPVVQEV